MSAHARLGPSATHRWLMCPASVRLSALVPCRDSGPAAAAGSVMHIVFERLMLGQDHLRQSEIKELDVYECSEKYARKIIDQAVLAARAALRKYGLTEFLTETRVNPGARFGRTDLWGTADLVAACEKTKTLMVGDLKTGRGRVDADHNDQMLTYAVGATDVITFRPTNVILAIFQPVIYGTNPNIWVTNYPTLMGFESFMAERAALTDLPDYPPEPSDDACRWCPAKKICPAH
jgi:hypothetical protein